MVRFSVTMDDGLTGTIDKSCAKKKISRSDWISEACTTHLAKGNGTGTVGATTLPSAGPVLVLKTIICRTMRKCTRISGSMSPNILTSVLM